MREHAEKHNLFCSAGGWPCPLRCWEWTDNPPPVGVIDNPMPYEELKVWVEMSGVGYRTCTKCNGEGVISYEQRQEEEGTESRSLSDDPELPVSSDPGQEEGSVQAGVPWCLTHNREAKHHFVAAICPNDVGCVVTNAR